MTAILIIIGVALVANFILIIAIMKRKSSTGSQPAEELYKKLRQTSDELSSDEKTTSLSKHDENVYREKAEYGGVSAAAAIEEKTEVLHPISNLSKEEKNELEKIPVSDATMVLNQPKEQKPLPTAHIIEYHVGNRTEQFKWHGQEVVRIGRDSDQSDLVIIDDGYIGRTHALLYEKSGELFLVDLASKNGTFIESVAVKGQQEIQLNQFFKIGQTELVVK
jgi:hypothetical protein